MSSHGSSIRSFTAALHRIEKQNQKWIREAEKQEFKRQQVENATNVIRNQDQLIHDITSLHVDDPVYVSWEDIRNEPSPVEPSYSAKGEQAARSRLEKFKPTWFDKLIGYKRKLKGLERNIAKAAKMDQKRHAQAVEEHEIQLKTWDTLQHLSQGIFLQDISAYKEAVEYFHLFKDVRGLGSTLTMTFAKTNVTVDLYVQATGVIPDHLYSRTSTGKLSTKTMPQGKHNRMYQDHVCSAVLRIARDLIALLPLDAIVVNAICNRLNSSTGKMEDHVLLSVHFEPASLNDLNFSDLNSSDAMRNFQHKMKFTQTAGFAAVEKIDIGSLRQSHKCRNGQ